MFHNNFKAPSLMQTLEQPNGLCFCDFAMIIRSCTLHSCVLVTSSHKGNEVESTRNFLDSIRTRCQDSKNAELHEIDFL